jgi:hypothetical protein
MHWPQIVVLVFCFGYGLLVARQAVRGAVRRERGRIASELHRRADKPTNRELLSVVYNSVATSIYADRVGDDDRGDDENRKFVDLVIRNQISKNLLDQCHKTDSICLHNIYALFANAVSSGAEAGDYLPRRLGSCGEGIAGEKVPEAKN